MYTLYSLLIVYVNADLCHLDVQELCLQLLHLDPGVPEVLADRRDRRIPDIQVHQHDPEILLLPLDLADLKCSVRVKDDIILPTARISFVFGTNVLFRSCVTKPLARLLEPLRIATILNIYLSNGM